MYIETNDDYIFNNRSNCRCCGDYWSFYYNICGEKWVKRFSCLFFKDRYISFLDKFNDTRARCKFL